MKFVPDDYRFAALERIQAARVMYDVGSFTECVYLVGLATECMLRAYRLRSDPEFDSRHDLPELLQASGLEGFVPLKRREEVAATLADIWIRWKNDYRFASEDRLKRALRKRGLFEGVRGDQLKANAKTALDSGLKIVGIGDARWKSSNR